MKFRYLRIAFSVLCGVGCVLLIVMWVRSYWWNDGISGTNGSAFTRILTVQGNIYLQRLAPNRDGPIPWKSFHKPIAQYQCAGCSVLSARQWLGGCDTVLVANRKYCCSFGRPLAQIAILSPHSANRHDAGCGGAGPNRLAGAPMRFKKLRIAWSVGWGVICVLVVTLWVCSYWNLYSAIRLVSTKTSACFLVQEGQLEVNWTSDPTEVSLVKRHNGPGWTGGITPLTEYYWELEHGGTDYDGPHPFGSPLLRRFVFDKERVVIPLWFPSVLFAALASLPWLRWKLACALC